MTPRDALIARGRAFDLLADLIAHGPRRDHVARTSLAPLLPSDPDEGAAEHQRVFGREIPPFGSLWFHPEGLLGGDMQTEVRALMAEAGFEPRDEPDHVSEGLRLFAWLAGAEADALEDRAPALAHIRSLTERARVALGWVPLLHATVTRVGSPLYEEALSLVVGLIGATPVRPLPDFEAPKKLPRRLAIPAACGIVWTYASLHRIGRETGVPGGMRSRFEMLDNLLDEGTRFGLRAEILAAFDAELAAVDALLPASVEPFKARIAATRTLLGE